MYELKVTNNRGEVLNLSSDPNYNVVKIEGLNPPQATVNSATNSTQDGSSVNSVRVESRNIVLYVYLNGDLDTTRLKLYKYFPIKRTVTLNYKTDTREVLIDGIVQLIECDLFTQRQIAQISLICPQPFFRDVEDLISTFGDVSPLFEFPFDMEESGEPISELTPNQRKSIVNAGEIATGVIIKLSAKGNVVNPTLYNVLAGTQMSFNITLQTSDELIINTNVGSKSVTLLRGGVESNALGYMSPDSDWFILENGDNLFTYEADSGTSNLEITFRSAVLYGGV